MIPRDVQANRLSEKLRREFGPVVLKALSDPDVIEIILNPDGGAAALGATQLMTALFPLGGGALL